jgi:hypothetical protein
MSDDGKTVKAPEASTYLSNRVAPCTLFTTLYGLSSGYIRGEASLALSLYSYSVLGLLGSFSFFGTAYASRLLRKETNDNYINYVVSGGLNSAAITTFRWGWKRGLLGGAVGAMLGGVSYLGVKIIYDSSREKWIDYRIYMLQQSTERKVYMNKPSFSSKRIEVDLSRGKIGMREAASYVSSDSKVGTDGKDADSSTKS